MAADDGAEWRPGWSRWRRRRQDEPELAELPDGHAHEDSDSVSTVISTGTMSMARSAATPRARCSMAWRRMARLHGLDPRGASARPGRPAGLAAPPARPALSCDLYLAHRRLDRRRVRRHPPDHLPPPR